MFRVIDCSNHQAKLKELKNKRHDLMVNNAQKYVTACIPYFVENTEPDVKNLQRLVFYGVNMVNSVYRSFNQSLNSEQAYKVFFDMTNVILDAISLLTPRDILSFFPPAKEYDGKRYEAKDYFTAMEFLNEIGGMDTVIGKNADDFIIDIMNKKLMSFAVTRTCVANQLMRFQGQPDMIEQFFGKPAYTIQQGVSGKNFLYDPASQKSYALAPKRPRYLKVVKRT